MRLVVFGQKDFAAKANASPNLPLYPEFLPQPNRNEVQETGHSPWNNRQVGPQDTAKFQKWILIENHQIELLGRKSGRFKAIRYGIFGEADGMLRSGNTLLFRRGHDSTVDEQTGS